MKIISRGAEAQAYDRLKVRFHSWNYLDEEINRGVEFRYLVRNVLKIGRKFEN